MPATSLVGNHQEIGASAERHPPERGVLVGLCLPMLLSSLGSSLVNVGLPAIAESFRAPFQDVQWIVLAYLLAVTTLIVGVGRLGDLVGRRRLLLAGIGLHTAASLLCALAPTLGFLIAARALQGLGAAIMMTLALALVADVLPPTRTGRAMGWLGTMSALGTALGPSLGGLLIAGAGWRSLFLLGVPLGMLALRLARSSLLDDRRGSRPDRAGFDAAGTLVLAPTLGAFALGMTSTHGSLTGWNAVLLLGAVAGVAAFLRVEARVASPLIRPETLRDPVLGAGLILNALVSTVMMATLVVGPFHLSRALGLDPAGVGLALSVGPVVAAVAGVPAGRLTDRLGAPRVTVVGLLNLAVGALLLVVLPDGWGVAGYLAPVTIITAGYALFQAANNTAVMTWSPAWQQGVASGLLNVSRHLGFIAGASVLGSVFAFATKGDIATAHPAQVALGMRTTFAFASVLMAAALIPAIRSLQGTTGACTRSQCAKARRIASSVASSSRPRSSARNRRTR